MLRILSLLCFVVLMGLPQLSLAESFEVKWGLVLPLSGPVAKAGIDIQRGFDMALADIDHGTVKHTLIVEDSQYQTRGAASAAQKLLAVDKVDIIVALWDTADVVAPLAESYNRVHASIRWNSNLANDFSNTFTFESTYRDYAESFLKLFKQVGVSRVAILNQESNGWNLALNVFKERAKASGITLTSTQSYLASENDHRVFAIRALKDKPDVVLINDVGENLELITKQLRSLNSRQRVTGYLDYPIDLSLFEGEYYVAQLTTDSAFARRYEKAYGEPIYSRAQLAYDLATIVSGVYQSFDIKPSTEQVVESLRQVKAHDGKAGQIINTDNGKVFRTQCVMKQVKDGAGVIKNFG